MAFEVTGEVGGPEAFIHIMDVSQVGKGQHPILDTPPVGLPRAPEDKGCLVHPMHVSPHSLLAGIREPCQKINFGYNLAKIFIKYGVWARAATKNVKIYAYRLDICRC